jgi:ADP-ribose pyrophosphatase YjhB (NUDIX family)
LEELFEAWTWGQLGLHAKPVALLDVEDFYRPLVEQLQVMCSAGYLAEAHLQALGVVYSAGEFLEFVDGYRHPPRKWTLVSAGGNLDFAAGASAPARSVATLISVGWVCVQDGCLLAVRSHGRDRFYLPGGKPEDGESLERALIREVREELGLDLTGLRSAFTVQAPAHGLPAGTALTMHCFYAEHSGDPQPAREIAELAWLRLADVHRAAPAVEKVLRRLAARQSQ